jgi:hypothetical protein
MSVRSVSDIPLQLAPSTLLSTYHTHNRVTMASHRSATFSDQPYSDPNPLPSSVPHVEELGTTSAPLKSISFQLGSHCKAVNGVCDNERADVR